MGEPLRVLIIEDSEDDAMLLLGELRRGGYDPIFERVDTRESMIAALDRQSWDITISDYMMPDFRGTDALDIVIERGLDIPFLIVSGNIGEDRAVAAMKAGAHDYLIKGRLGRLVPAVQRELREAQVRRERAKADKALREALARLQALSHHVLEIQETERQRISRELHDEVGQTLTVQLMQLHSALEHTRSTVLKKQLLDCIDTAQQSLEQIRAICMDLRPPQLDDLGLIEALRAHLHRQTEGTSIAMRFDADPLPTRLHPDTEITCFRIVQESVNNVVRHAQARNLYAELRVHDAELLLSVRDDGNGFDLEEAHARALRVGRMGLLGMQERALLAEGHVDIESAPGRGTEVRARLPLRLTKASSQADGDDNG